LILIDIREILKNVQEIVREIPKKQTKSDESSIPISDDFPLKNLEELHAIRSGSTFANREGIR